MKMETRKFSHPRQPNFGIPKQHFVDPCELCLANLGTDLALDH